MNIKLLLAAFMVSLSTLCLAQPQIELSSPSNTPKLIGAIEGEWRSTKDVQWYTTYLQFQLDGQYTMYKFDENQNKKVLQYGKVWVYDSVAGACADWLRQKKLRVIVGKVSNEEIPLAGGKCPKYVEPGYHGMIMSIQSDLDKVDDTAWWPLIWGFDKNGALDLNQGGEGRWGGDFWPNR